MSYTPPSGGTVGLDFGHAAYTPDSGGAVSLEFSDAVNFSVSITEANDTLSAALAAVLAVSVSITEANDTLSATLALLDVVGGTIAEADDALIAIISLDPLAAYNYPSTFILAAGTKRTRREGMRIRQATNGAVRPRAISAAARADPLLVHERMTAVQIQALKDFEVTVRNQQYFNVGYTPEGLTLHCMFGDPPFKYDQARGVYPPAFDVNVNLIQVD